MAMKKSTAARNFPVYLEVHVGGTSKQKLQQELDANGYIGDCARTMMSRPGFATATTSRVIKVVRVQLRELGFTDWVLWSDIIKGAGEVGGARLPAEAGPRIWLELSDQQPGDHFWILMDPIADAGGDPYVFYAVCNDDGERRLLGRHLPPGRRFYPHHGILFAVRDQGAAVFRNHRK
jgi:hypothetical protein